MQFAAVRAIAMSLPDATEEPHHQFGSFRVRGKIFVTVPPGQEHIHVFVPEEQRELALALYADFVEKLLWGGKVVGLKIALAKAEPSAVEALVRQAWAYKAPRALASATVAARK